MQGSGAQMIVDRHMADWIQQNFVKVAMVPVKVEEIPFDELVLPEKKAKEIRATVASLRLDAVGAAGFGVSRSKMVSAISGDKSRLWNLREKAARDAPAYGLTDINNLNRAVQAIHGSSGCQMSGHIKEDTQ